VAAMYAAYRRGLSVGAVANLYHRTRQSVFSVFQSRGYELRHKQMIGAVKIRGVRFIPTKGGYLRGTVPDGRRMLAHQWIWEKKHGEIPDGMTLHFIDGNPKNVKIENLELVPREKHPELFARHGKPAQDWKAIKCLQCGHSKHVCRGKDKKSIPCFAIDADGKVTAKYRRHLFNANPIRKSWT
jgi:hypothetical protein